MILLDGKLTSEKIKEEIKIEVQEIIKNGGRPPHLVAVLVGNDGASLTYVGSKVRSCEKIGFKSTLIHLDENISEEELISEIDKLNNNNKIDGYIVQLPLPKHINEEKILMRVNPDKDVDGFHPFNFGKMAQNMDSFIPATPYGIIELIDRYGIETEGKNTVVIGRSNIVGRPMSILMSNKSEPGNSTVTLVHSRTPDIPSFTKKADIIIVALGIPNFLKSEMIKQDSVVIDVGITRVEDKTKARGYRIVGDVDFESVKNKVSHITPVPGGVGPMTIAMLLKNTLKARKNN